MTKICKSTSGSYIHTIPKDYIYKLGWGTSTKTKVDVRAGKIIISKL
jgi:hypothetical protein